VIKFILRIVDFFRTIFSILILNLKFLFKKIFVKNVKIVLFYFPIKSYQENLIELINEIKKEKNFEVFLGFNQGSSNEIQFNKNSYFINPGYLKYIYMLDIFISSYIVYTFPKSINKIYINHDIYDAPMVRKESENNLAKSLCDYNYIFTSSTVTIEMLQKKINSFNAQNLEKPKIINTGYLKLDHVHRLISKNKNFEDSILLAPTKSLVYLDFDLSRYLEEIIDKILSIKNSNLVYRPHPSDLKDEIRIREIEKIYNLFKNYKNFTIDKNTSYLDSYKKAKFMITDFSGTAYTFAFCKLKPVIFFSNNENELIKSDLSNLYYFKDRNDIGIIESNLNNLNNSIDYIENNIDIFREKIKRLRSDRIQYFDVSMQQNIKNIKKILNNE
tara:strand:+ start:6748 stop:7908 length:1161 start_codon:yes stop_codon:yes gene_type:complete